MDRTERIDFQATSDPGLQPGADRGEDRLLSYRQLYELWERQHWQASAIDFSQDVRDWEALSETDKADISFVLSSFFIGEERVTTQFSGLVQAYEGQAEEAFLTTQQVDEARHTQHFNNFYAQVLGRDGTFDDRLEQARADLNDDFVRLFDGYLVDAGKALIADPSDVGAKVDFVTTYHMIIEGTLALTGQNFVTRAFEDRGILPGFIEGFKKISQDEHRHVAYGTWYLQTKAADPALRKRIADRLLELLPTTAGVLVPPGADPENFSLLGFAGEEVNTFAFTALSRRLRVIGVDLAAATAA